MNVIKWLAYYLTAILNILENQFIFQSLNPSYYYNPFLTSLCIGSFYCPHALLSNWTGCNLIWCTDYKGNSVVVAWYDALSRLGEVDFF